MSFFTTIEHLFSGAEAELGRVTAGFSTVEKAVQSVLGIAEEASGVLAAVDPAIGAPVLAAVSALDAAYTATKTALGSGASAAGQLAQQVTTLGSQALDTFVALGPYYKAVGNDLGTAVAAAKTLPVPAVAAAA